jgi:PPOX class probable F420-dependent enzyme
MAASAESIGFEDLEGERYLSITTFKQDGSPASTPVWFVSDDLRRRLLVATGATTWKVRRIRHNPHVRVAACTARGRVTGAPIDGIARFVDETDLVRSLQAEKYGWQKALIEKAYALSRWITRKPTEEAVFIEIVPRTELERLPEARAA